MPLEIRELVVKVTVDDSRKKEGITEKELQVLKSKIVKECMEKVMAKLRQLSQR